MGDFRILSKILRLFYWFWGYFRLSGPTSYFSTFHHTFIAFGAETRFVAKIVRILHELVFLNQTNVNYGQFCRILTDRPNFFCACVPVLQKRPTRRTLPRLETSKAETHQTILRTHHRTTYLLSSEFRTFYSRPSFLH